MGKTDTPPQRLNVDGFDGVVMLKHWLAHPNGRNYIGFKGKVTVLRDVEAVGFPVSGGESNWMVRVQGPTQSINVLGCQVRGAYEGAGLEPEGNEILDLP